MGDRQQRIRATPELRALELGEPVECVAPPRARLHVWLIATKRTHLLLGYIVLGFRHPPLARADSAADSAAIT